MHSYYSLNSLCCRTFWFRDISSWREAKCALWQEQRGHIQETYSLVHWAKGGYKPYNWCLEVLQQFPSKVGTVHQQEGWWFLLIQLSTISSMWADEPVRCCTPMSRYTHTVMFGNFQQTKGNQKITICWQEKMLNNKCHRKAAVDDQSQSIFAYWLNMYYCFLSNFLYKAPLIQDIQVLGED